MTRTFGCVLVCLNGRITQDMIYPMINSFSKLFMLYICCLSSISADSNQAHWV